jgi:predicted PurR-regulated permease PerM
MDSEHKRNHIINNNTFFFKNDEFEELYDSEITEVTQLLLNLKREIDTNGLRKEIILAFLTRPLFRRLDRRLSRSAAAGLVLLVTVFVAVLPVLVLVVAVADDVAMLANTFSVDQTAIVPAIESLIEQYTGQPVDVADRVESSLEVIANWAVGTAPGILGAAASLLLGPSVMLIVQFYFVRDWASFADWTREFDVLPTAIQNRLYTSTGRATRSVVKGHVFVAILQGLAAGLGLWLAGFPRVMLLTYLMIILSFIPIIGAALIWAPAGLYLIAIGNPFVGIGVLLYGVILIGAIDNIARPFLLDEAVKLHDLFVILGVIGGVSVFGPIGLFIGPVIFAVLGELLDDGLLQFGDAVRGRVGGVALVEGPFAGLDDVLGRREVRFADREVDDVDAVCFQLRCEVTDCERRAGFDPFDAVCEVHSHCSSSARSIALRTAVAP